jgi:hypothetical protein
LAATAAMLFGAANHFYTKDSYGELSYNYKDIQSKYVGNLDKLKLFRKCMDLFDIFDLFSYLSGLNWMPSVYWVVGGIGRKMRSI